MNYTLFAYCVEFIQNNNITIKSKIDFWVLLIIYIHLAQF